MVERWFRELTEKAIRRRVSKSAPDLIAAIEAYLQANNNDPKPFVWTAPAATSGMRSTVGSHPLDDTV